MEVEDGKILLTDTEYWALRRNVSMSEFMEWYQATIYHGESDKYWRNGKLMALIDGVVAVFVLPRNAAETKDAVRDAVEKIRRAIVVEGGERA